MVERSVVRTASNKGFVISQKSTFTEWYVALPAPTVSQRHRPRHSRHVGGTDDEVDVLGVAPFDEGKERNAVDQQEVGMQALEIVEPSMEGRAQIVLTHGCPGVERDRVRQDGIEREVRRLSQSDGLPATRPRARPM